MVSAASSSSADPRTSAGIHPIERTHHTHSPCPTSHTHRHPEKIVFHSLFRSGYAAGCCALAGLVAVFYLDLFQSQQDPCGPPCPLAVMRLEQSRWSCSGAAVDQSARTPAPEHKTCKIVLPVLFSFLLVASLVAIWWVRRRTASRVLNRGTLALPVPIPSFAYLRLNRSSYHPPTSCAHPSILRMANPLTATPIGTQPPRRLWTNPEIILAGLSVLLTVIGLVLGGLSLLYAQRQVSSHASGSISPRRLLYCFHSMTTCSHL